MSPTPLDLAVSPYHLTTREVPAMAALLLGDRVVTLMPTPAAGSSREQFSEAVERSPRYLRLVESWRWTGPLWKSGHVAAAMDDEAPFSEFGGVVEDIEQDAAFSPLRPLVRALHALSQDEFLDAISADILKGGPDPAMNIPIAAALDRFAARHGVVVVRAGPTSVAQRAESRTADRLFSIAIPMLLRAHGGRLEEAREAFGEELRPLRRTLVEVLDLARRGTPPDAGVVAGLRAAAERFATAFKSHPSITGSDDEDGLRVTWGWVSVVGVSMPADCVLRSSRAAIRTMQGSPVPAGREGGGSAGSGRPERVLSIIIREMNLTPDES